MKFYPCVVSSLVLVASHSANAQPEVRDEYIIWPTDPFNEVQNAITIQFIRDVVEPNFVYKYESLYDGIVWWLANCTVSMASDG